MTSHYISTQSHTAQFSMVMSSVILYPICIILKLLLLGFKRICQESSILDLWANDGNFDDRSAAASAIASATKEDILNKINDESMRWEGLQISRLGTLLTAILSILLPASGLFLRNMDFVGSLGVVERDNITGRVTSAKAARFSFVGLPKPADNRSGNPVMDMEAALIKVVLDKSWHMDGFRVDGIFSRSTGDVATNAVYADLPMLIAGFAIVYAYVTVTMGKLDQVECRVRRYFMPNGCARSQNDFNFKDLPRGGGHPFSAGGRHGGLRLGLRLRPIYKPNAWADAIPHCGAW